MLDIEIANVWLSIFVGGFFKFHQMLYLNLNVVVVVQDRTSAFGTKFANRFNLIYSGSELIKIKRIACLIQFERKRKTN